MIRMMDIVRLRFEPDRLMMRTRMRTMSSATTTMMDQLKPSRQQRMHTLSTSA
jgi:hypothetical protein